MPEVAIVMSPGQRAGLFELAETIRYELGLQGIPTSMQTEGFPEPRPGLVYAMFGLRDFLELEGELGLPDTTILARTVLIGDERPEVAAGGPRYQELLGHFGAVFSTDVRSVLALHRVGIRARTLRPGYSKPIDHFDPEAERAIEVFLSAPADDRRRRLLAHWAATLSRHNCLINLASTHARPGVDQASHLGAGRFALLARSQVAVLVHEEGQRTVSWGQMLDAMHCGAVVLSEHAAGTAPFTVGEHLLTASAESLPHVLEDLLEDPDRLAAIRSAAYERLSRWLPYGLAIGVLRAAIVELVGRPIPPTARRPSRFRGVDGEVRWWETGEAPLDSPDGAAVGGLLAQERAAHRAQRELIQTELAALAQSVDSLQRSAASAAHLPAVRIVRDSPRWSAAGGGGVGVVLAAGEDGDAVAASLDALSRSRDPDFHVVVAGRAGDGLSAVERWSAAHPRMAMRILELGGPGGVGAARNAALDHLRSDLALVLAPGDRITPRGIDVLGGTLRASENVSLVYPICVLSYAGQPNDLIGYEAWQPSLLRSERFISTPYILRRGALRELGGYVTRSELAGWEDYDLLCRLADDGRSVQLVPQILAGAARRAPRQVLGEESLRLEALSARAPRLLAGVSAD